MHSPRACRADSVASGHAAAMTALYPAQRLRLAADAARTAGLGALLLTPARPALCDRHDAGSWRALATCLAPPGQCSRSRRGRCRAGRTGPCARGFGFEMIPWDETDDPYELVARRLGPVSSVGLSDRMWAMMVPGSGRAAAAGPGQRGAAGPAVAQEPGRGGGAPRGRRGHRPGARRRTGLAAPRPDRARGRRGRGRRDQQRRSHADGLRDHRVGAERGEPAPRAVRPGAAAWRRRGRGHRRHHAQRVLLRLHPRLR